MSVCQGCGAAIAQPARSGRRRKWCSERCRKDTTYARFCEDCGTRISSSDGHGPNAPKRCVSCAPRASGAARRTWTQGLILARVREWYGLHGEPPTGPDWSPTHARILGDDERAQRFERADGHWPHVATVHRAFGSWNAAIAAAGFTPRAAHGGEGNQFRRRRARAA